MFGTIRKHQTWLWAIIITLTIISFVIFFSPYSKLNSTRRGPVNLGSINGERIGEEDFIKARREIFLRSFFTTGNWPDEEAKKQGGDLDRDTYQWLLLLQEQQRLGIHLSTDVVAQAAKVMISHFERGGINSPEMFIEQVLKRAGFGADDLERFVRHYLGVQELISVVGVGGKLVVPQEIRDLYKRENEEISTAAVFFSASNYTAGVSAPPEIVMQFFTNRQAMYRVPDRVRVKYVAFDLTNYLAQANQAMAKMTNLDFQVEEAYRQGGTNFLRDVKAQTLGEAKVKVREARLKELELQSARKQALEFATPLFDLEPMQADNLDKLAKEKGLAVRVTAAFDREEGPKDLEVGQDFAQKAFSRTPADPFAGPIIGMNGVYVVALDKKFASEIPPLDQIRARVEQDFRHAQALDVARRVGAGFYQTLTNGMAQGKTVEALCAEGKFHLVEIPPFSISTRELPQVEAHLSLNQYKQIAFTSPLGKVSPFQMTTDGGVIVYVKSKLPLDEAKMNASLTAFINSVRNSRQNELFNDWFRKEAEKGLRDTPLARPQTPAMSSTSKATKS